MCVGVRIRDLLRVSLAFAAAAIRKEKCIGDRTFDYCRVLRSLEDFLDDQDGRQAPKGMNPSSPPFLNVKYAG